MATALDREIRRLLDKAVRKARIVAEDGARKALTELALEDAKKPEGLSPTRIDLRNRLRAHARSLGDIMQSDGSIQANRLVREIAYEHWHRALFARFLAENNLLIDPDHKVAVSLSDMEEIAKEEGRDLVELAADWAEPMLPQIFRKDDPVLALALPPETKAGITEIVKDLPRVVFAADDSLGWVYQFWQADQKDRVNESEVKIGADELPAVTQLFTEDYMVLFLLENTLGAWWAGKVLASDSTLAANATSEDELREKTSLPGYRWTYLRFMREPRHGETHQTATGLWRPVTGVFERWPKAAKDITVLDPSMGSGHFLVFALPIFVAFRRAEEGLDERAAVKAVLADNLFGLEIDPRCTQIAAFALALASWKRLGGPEPLPRLKLACSGLAIGLGKLDFLKLAERIAAKRGWKPTTDLLGDGATPIESAAIKREREGLSRLYDLFDQAPALGSLIDPRRVSDDLFAAGYEALAELIEEVLQAGQPTPELHELAVTAQGLAQAAAYLSGRYALIATNVPYLGRGRQTGLLRAFADRFHRTARADLAAMMLQRFQNQLSDGGLFAVVSPQSWFYLGSYTELRRELLSGLTWKFAAKLGSGAFETISGEVVNVSLVGIASASPSTDTAFYSIDVQSERSPTNKAAALISARGKINRQKDQLSHPDSRIVTDDLGQGQLLQDFVQPLVGLQNGDTPRFILQFWELPKKTDAFEFFQLTAEERGIFQGRTAVLFWEKGRGALSELPGAFIKGVQAWTKEGIVIRQMDLVPSLYSGDMFDQSSTALIPKRKSELPAIFSFVQSDEYRRVVKAIDPGSKVTTATMAKVPFDLAHWQKVASENYPNGLPKPFSNDPTQWLFDGHPRGSADPNVARGSTANRRLVTSLGIRPGIAEHPLQVAVARLLGYRWPRQAGSSFMDCPTVAEPDEIDRSGLVDTDGIVPLPALGGDADAATRLRDLIRAVWGPDYREGTIRELLAAEEAEATDLGSWLADEFFDGHCGLFRQAPFIWHIWDGVRGGFSALVNYHRLCDGNGAGRRLLEKLRDSYLGEWIAAQKRALAASEARAEERLIAAEHLRSELTKIIEGEPPYDIFARWKPLCHQPVGWEPDIDDGVRVNIRPFLAAKPKNSGRKDGCILRVTPRVKKHEGADRGAEPRREKDDFPWLWADDNDVATENFAGGPSFKGRRYNDFHYKRGFKQRARDAKAKAGRGVA